MAAVLTAGLVLRLVLALGVFRGQGFAPDVDLFVRWADGVWVHGPWAFYGGDATANYPPLAIAVLGGVRALVAMISAVSAMPAVPTIPVGETDAWVAALMKLPSCLADVASGWLVWHLARRRTGFGPALAATAMFLVLPPVLYVSALWGQLDGLLLLASLGALALAVRGRLLGAGVVAVLAVLIKPQGIVVLLVVVVVLAAERLRRRGRSGRGRRGEAGRLVAELAVMAAAGLAVMVPFDLRALAPAPLTGVPVVGDLAGLLRQSVDTAGLFPVLTANAENAWALVGSPSLAATLHTGTAVWHTDATRVLGVPAALLGAASLSLVVVLVVVGLVRRRDETAVLLAFVVLSFAFFAFPTRVHERYLTPAFGALCVLVAGRVWAWLATWVVAAANTVNLHGVLASPPQHVTLGADGARVATGVRMPATAPTPPITAWPALPWGAAARAELVVTTVSFVQTGAAVALLVLWCVVALGAGPKAHAAAAPPP